MVNMHKTYTPPRVLRKAELVPEQSLLGGSVTNSLNMGGVDTTPQTVEDRNFDSNSFNFQWE